MHNPINAAFRDLLGSAPRCPGDICFIIDDGMPNFSDHQMVEGNTSFYFVARKAWPSVRSELERQIGAPPEALFRIIDFDPDGDYGDLFTRIGNAAARNIRREVRRWRY